ncbi:histidinol-phosphate transaminase [Gillisia sp. Hel_I_29]|uniref:histidinol-phosphate transaminase n=1 Tax=Gillisia sp. Hel_I_29 TaxID=1249975 RepID=UPI000556804B|nr:histidinol-phosphate transaminase [Gillisia sp. Hel_I_29]
MQQFNLNNLVRENVAKLNPYSSARDEFKATGSEMVFLDANENPFQTDVNRYPDPQQRDLKAAIGNLKGINTSKILLGNGSDEVLDLLYRAFCEPKMDNVISLPPTYGMYSVLANINNIENREVLLNDSFQPNVDEILNSVDKNTKIIFLCSPNNPTGNSFSKDKVERILTDFSGLVVIDEAYIDFAVQESWLLSLENYPNLIITQTLSKAYGLAGIRLGICYASSEIITILNRIKPPYNVNELTQKRALERVLSKEEVKLEISSLIDQRAVLIKELLQVKFINEIYPTDANFVLVKVDNATQRYNELINKGIVIRNRTTQPLCNNTLRFTIGKSEENKKLIDALKELD